MSMLPDHEILKLSKNGMISPYVSNQIRESNGKKIISYGVSSYGYDIRLTDKFKIFNARSFYDNDLSTVQASCVDPKNFDPSNVVDFNGDICIIPPHSFVLGTSIESFNIPDNIMGVCFGKSTYARCGCITNVTPLESGWSGHLTIEISNTTSLPLKVYAKEGICQIMFFYSTSRCRTTYADRHGKYQNQGSEVVLPRV